MADHEMLQDEPHRMVLRVGNTVRRPVHPWSSTIHELLQYLEAVGFPYSPRVLGIDEDGREVLSCIDGESGPAGWARVVDDAGLVAMAHLLREYHEAVAGFHPAPRRPGQPVLELPVLEYVAPFRGDVECLRWLRYPAPPSRRRRVERFAEAYGLTSTAGLVNEVISQQQVVVWERARRLAAQGRQPQVTWQADGAFGEVAERIRWSRENRYLFE